MSPEAKKALEDLLRSEPFSPSESERITRFVSRIADDATRDVDVWRAGESLRDFISPHLTDVGLGKGPGWSSLSFSLDGREYYCVIHPSNTGLRQLGVQHLVHGPSRAEALTEKPTQSTDGS